MEGFEQFVGVNFWTMIFAWCNLIILYLVLRKILFKPIMGMIEKRQQEIDGIYSEAEGYLDDAKASKAEYEQKLDKVKQEGEEYMKKTVKRAQEREEEILREADDKAERKLRRAEEQIELERKRAVNEVKDEVSEMAIEIAAAVIERDINGSEHAELIDGFIARMGDDHGTAQ